jgi:uncharacterized phage-associated protein
MKKEVTSLDVAKFFLTACDVDTAGDLISNLKMQKLVYYAQGFHLAMFNKRLFDEGLEAWMHGPVSPSLYHELKRFGLGAIELDKIGDIDLDVFTKEQKYLLEDVYRNYGQYSAWILRNMTHKELPWAKVTRNGRDVGSGKPIPDSLLIKYFKTRLDDE